MDEVAELERVRARLAAIPGSEALLQALFALAPVGFQIYDASGHSLLVNQAFRDLFGSEPPPEYNVLVDEIAASTGVLALVKRAFAGEVIGTPPFWYDPRELTQVKVEGRRVAIVMTFFPLRNPAGEVAHVGAVFKDVTAEMQKRAQEERARGEAEFLAASSAALARSLDLTTTLESLARLTIPYLADWCVIDVVGADGQLHTMATAHVDPVKEPLLAELRRRYPPRGATGWPAARVLSSGQPEMLPEVDDALVARLVIDDDHHEMVRRLGPRSNLIVPLVVRGGTALGTISLVFGDSGRRYGAAELRLATDLAARAALAIDNARLYQEARDAIQVREDFLSVAGHELKTPLTGMQIKLELVGRGLQRATAEAGGDDGAVGRRIADATQRLGDADRQLGRLGGLVDQLLDVTRLSAGKIALDAEETDLAALGREVVGRFEDEATRAGTPLTLQAPDQVVGVWDRMRLDQVFSNLVSNALKYGAGKPVEVEIGAGDGVAILQVRDRGIGIAPEHHARIFRKFERAVSERHFGGLGIGLWICQELVKAMRGRIDVDSAPGRGATFTVRLPAGSADRPSPAAS